MAKREKRVLSGRFWQAEVGSTLKLLARWHEDRTRRIQVTVFAEDIERLEAAIASFKRSSGVKEAAPVDAPLIGDDGRKKFKTISDA